MLQIRYPGRPICRAWVSSSLCTQTQEPLADLLNALYHIHTQTPILNLYMRRVARAGHHARRPPLEQVFPRLVDPEHRARDAQQPQNVQRPQRLRLKHALQKGQVDDTELPGETAGDGVVEHLVAEELDLAEQDGFRFGAAGERVEHVEEDEGGEGHGGVAAGHGELGAAVEEIGGGGGGVDVEKGGGVVVDQDHLADVDGERAEHDDHGGGEDAAEEGFGEDVGAARSRGLGHDTRVDGFDAEGLRGGAVHEDIWVWVSGGKGMVCSLLTDPQNLHCVQGILEAERSGDED